MGESCSVGEGVAKPAIFKKERLVLGAALDPAHRRSHFGLGHHFFSAALFHFLHGVVLLS